MKTIHEIRDPVHTFIQIDNDERTVVDSLPIQRLRDVGQLALTYLVYPGATHKRFEHSLGVMELAGRVFEVVTNPVNLHDDIRGQFEDAEAPERLAYWRRVVRLAGLCHDIGHLPFSHAAERELLPDGWNHERMSKELILSDAMKPIWDDMTPPVKPLHVAKLAVGQKELKEEKFSDWETILSEIIVGDAFGVDRMDYLLRDSIHTGVRYGQFDHYRLIDTLRILPSPGETSEPQLGITEGGIHSAEALLLARYFMFTQVYFHPVRRAYDSHLKDFLRAWLKDGVFSTSLNEHLWLTDGAVLEAMKIASRAEDMPGHDSAKRILMRRHFRVLWESNPADLDVNPQAGLVIFEAAIKEFGDESVKRDDHAPAGPVIDFPVEIFDGRTTSAQAMSSVLQSIPPAAFDYVMIAPEIADTARTWLETNRDKILQSSLEKE